MESITRSSWGWAVSLLILAGLAPVTWLFPTTLGYILSGSFVLAMLGLSIYNGSVLRVQRPVFIGLGVYWLVLVAHLVFTDSTGIIPYILLLPLVVVALMTGGAHLIENDPTGFATGVVVLSSTLVIIGLVILWGYLWGWWPAISMTGRPALGLFRLRIASIYGNSNHLGFTAAFGALSATYLWQTTKQNHWRIFIGFLIGGTAMANARTSLIAGVVGIGIIVIHTRRQAMRLVPLGVLAAAGFAVTLLSGFVTELLSSLLLRLETWGVTIQAIAAEPWIGAAWSSSFGTHNIFLTVIHQTGIIGGVSYIAIHVLALMYAARRSFDGSTFDRYVFAVVVFLLTTQFFSTSSLGGLTTPSLLLAVFIGLAARNGSVLLPWRGRQFMDINTSRQDDQQMH